LDGLIYLVCKLYILIDDVLIDGADEETYVNNVRQVFDRFRNRKMIVNPKKTKEVEYIGHLVSHKTISSTNFEVAGVGLSCSVHDHKNN